MPAGVAQSVPRARGGRPAAAVARPRPLGRGRAPAGAAGARRGAGAGGALPLPLGRARLPRGVAAAAKPKLTREAEPEEAWLSKAEKEGKSPFKDPLAISAILGLLVPFVILGIAIGTGYIDVS